MTYFDDQKYFVNILAENKITTYWICFSLFDIKCTGNINGLP